jgi:hypothetical protein
MLSGAEVSALGAAIGVSTGGSCLYSLSTPVAVTMAQLILFQSVILSPMMDEVEFLVFGRFGMGTALLYPFDLDPWMRQRV